VEGAPATVVAGALGFSGATTNAGVVVVEVRGATTDAAGPGVGGAAAVVTGASGSATTVVIAVDIHGQASIDTMANIPDMGDKFLNLERGSFNDLLVILFLAFLENNRILRVIVNMPCRPCCPCGFVYYTHSLH
jgi:hypothetical protein